MEENDQVTYSGAIAELEDLVRKMQSDECDIDHLADYTKRSLALLKICRDRLTKTDEELKRCLAELDNYNGK